MGKSVDPVNQTPQQVFEAVHSVMHLYRGQRGRGDAEAGAQLTHMEHKVLHFFARHPGATQSGLAAHAGRDKGQVARLVAGLKDRALLQAEADAGDRRNVRLSLTPEARAVLAAAERQARRRAAAAVAGLGSDECARLLALLQRVQANLEAAD